MFAVSAILFAQRGAVATPHRSSHNTHTTAHDDTLSTGEFRGGRRTARLEAWDGPVGSPSTSDPPNTFPAFLRGANLRPSTAAMVKRSIILGPSPSPSGDGSIGGGTSEVPTAARNRRGRSRSKKPLRYDFRFTSSDGGGLMRSVTLVGSVVSIRREVALSDVMVRGVPLGEGVPRGAGRGGLCDGNGDKKKRGRQSGGPLEACEQVDYAMSYRQSEMQSRDEYVYKARLPLAFGCPCPNAPLSRAIRQDTVDVVTITDGSGFVELIVPREDNGDENFGHKNLHDEDDFCEKEGRVLDKRPSKNDGARQGRFELSANRTNGVDRLGQLLRLHEDEEQVEGDDEESMRCASEPTGENTLLIDALGSEIKPHDYLFVIAFPSTELNNDHVRMHASDTEGASYFGRSERSHDPDCYHPGRVPREAPHGFDLNGMDITTIRQSSSARKTGPRLFAAVLRVLDDSTEVAHHGLTVLTTRARLLTAPNSTDQEY